MAISTNGAVIARLAGGLYNTVLSNATYLEVVAQDPSALANKLYAADFGKKTDAEVGKTLVANLGLSTLTGLDAWVAAQLTAAGAANKGAKVVELLNGFSQMTADTTYGTYATAFNAKVDAALAASQTTGKAEAKFETAGVTPAVTSFTLTTGVDAIVGSAGDDTITAPATVAATGAAQTTINSGDSIDGGAGTDTLTLTLAAANNNSLTGLTIKAVENIVYSGVNNLASGNADYAAAVIAKATTASTLAAAVAAKVAADAADVAQALVVTAATTVASASDATSSTTATGAKAATEALVTTGNATGATTVQIAAGKAASAALLSVTGVALTTDLDVAKRADTLLTDANNLKAATATLAGTGTTGAGAAETAAYLADVNAGAKVTATKALIGTVSLAANADATSITIDGTTTTVTGLKDTQKVTIGATSVADKLSYAATATVANLGLTSATGTVTFTDAGSGAEAKTVVTANVTGSVKATAATSAAKTSTPGTITLADTINTVGAIKTLNLALTSDATVNASSMAKVTTIDASASTGGINLTDSATTPASVINTTVLNISTGAGKDTVIFAPATVNTAAATTTASLKTGAGNDTITVNHTGSGTATVDAGDGDDSVTMTSALGTATVDGGAGKDTVTVTNAYSVSGTTPSGSFSTGGYNNMKVSLQNFEVLAFSGTADVDASKAAQFSEFTFKKASSLTDNNFISKVADTQIVNALANDVVINAAGYVAKGSTDTDGVTALSTTYAGALTVNAKGGAATDDTTEVNVIANASSVTLNVSVTAKSLDNTSSYVTLSGDVKSATVNVDRANDNTGLPTADVFSTVKIVTGTGVNTTTASTDLSVSYSATVPANTALNSLGNLSSLTLAGNGVASVNNASGTKLTTIDASGLSGKALNASGSGATAVKVGDATAGLTWTSGVSAETIKLGSALDNLTIAPANSTYAKMDSITGFSLVANAAGDLVTTKSDDLTVTGKTGFVKVSTAFTGSLDAALTAVAAKLSGTSATFYDMAVFQCSGNTYIFSESASGSLTVDDGDTVIELIGLVDLDLLVTALNA